MDDKAHVHYCTAGLMRSAALLVVALGGGSLIALIFNLFLYLATYCCYKTVTPPLKLCIRSVNITPLLLLARLKNSSPTF